MRHSVLIVHVIRTENLQQVREIFTSLFSRSNRVYKQYYEDLHVDVILVFVIKVVNITMHMTPNGCLSLHNM